jgi:hypothetical protein
VSALLKVAHDERDVRIQRTRHTCTIYRFTMEREKTKGHTKIDCVNFEIAVFS